MRGRLSLFVILMVALSLHMGAQTIDVNGKGVPFQHHWSVGTCAGRANEGLRTSWVEQLRMVKEHCGFQYLRMHGMFDDDMFVYFEDRKGNPVYNWQYLDEVYDRMLDIGIRPFVELSFFPKGIAADDGKVQMWYQNRITYDPKRLPKWKGLVEVFTRHVVERYGLEEVRRWYFEVWNEPNLNMTPKAGFFEGTRSDYFQLYKASAEAIKGVDSQLRVGGPATSNFIADHRHDGEVLDNTKSVFYDQASINKQDWKAVWMTEFLDFCAKEHLPVDFISCHAYPTDYALDPVSGKGKDAVRYVHSLHDDLTYLQRCLANSEYPNAEIHITEWSTSPSSRDRMHDLLPPAAYIVKGNLDNIGMASSVMYWTFTDIFEEKGGGESIFHGGFGMINFQGIVKPSFHAYRMLHQLGDEQLYYSSPMGEGQEGASLFVSRHSDSGKITALAFNYPQEFELRVPSSADSRTFMQATAKALNCMLKGLQPGTQFVVETLDYEHGNAYNEWQSIGAPHSPTRQQTAFLRERAWQTHKETLSVSDKGTLTIRQTLFPWTCVLIQQL